MDLWIYSSCERNNKHVIKFIDETESLELFNINKFDVFLKTRETEMIKELCKIFKINYKEKSNEIVKQ